MVSALVLKYMEKLEIAAGQLAGSGVKLWVIVQNFGQLQRHYDKSWETFIANAGAVPVSPTRTSRRWTTCGRSSAKCRCWGHGARTLPLQRCWAARAQCRMIYAMRRCWRSGRRHPRVGARERGRRTTSLEPKPRSFESAARSIGNFPTGPSNEFEREDRRFGAPGLAVGITLHSRHRAFPHPSRWLSNRLAA